MKLLTLTTLGLLAATSMAHAQDAKSLSQNADTHNERKAYYYEYDRAEQCQGYDLGVKRLGIQNPCGKKEVQPAMAQQNIEVLKEYVIYFDFDKDLIRDGNMSALSQAANEITHYNPSKVLIAGYTDTRGSDEYNSDLSARRAQSVSNYLTARGVNNFIVNEKAMGENSLAVPTADEVKMQENRRVKIQFIR